MNGFLAKYVFPPHFISDFVWLATGGMNGCFNKDAVEVLSGREVVLVPDFGATDKWKSKIPLLQSVCKRVAISNTWKTMPPMNKRPKVLTLQTSY